MSEPLIEVRGISKSFGGVHALKDVSFELAAGEVHALCGENGAGKSTLIKILSGSYVPDSGTIHVAGQPLRTGSVTAAENAGIAVIHQESVAFLHLSAEDNIFVGREPRCLGGLLLDRAAMSERTRELMERLGERIDQRAPLSSLPVAQRQMVGMARALSQRCKLLIMDEPTASLSARETEVLFRIVRQLRTDGVTILYVSHRMEEVFDLSDRVTVFRDGRYVATRPCKGLTREELIQLMAGRELAAFDPPRSTTTKAPTRLEVRNLGHQGVFEKINFSVRAGEIVGLAGLVGAGRSEVARAIFGVDRYDTGEVDVNDKPLPRASIKDALRAGLALVPEDRQHLGLVLPMTVGENLTMVVLKSLCRAGLCHSASERELADRYIRDLGIRTAGQDVPAETLSGGNQQKIVLGKWLATQPQVLLLDEPTRGVDVGAKAEVHRLIKRLAEEGMATLLISSEMPELLALCHRILVMRGGRIVGELPCHEATQEKILELALAEDSMAVAESARGQA
jgi:ABC-type sugar transport system ATPase subunit